MIMTQTYTKPDAIALMELGVKMTHKHFSPNEWITIKNREFLFEDGVVCEYSEFWNYRTEPSWNYDWFEFEQTTL